NAEERRRRICSILRDQRTAPARQREVAVTAGLMALSDDGLRLVVSAYRDLPLRQRVAGADHLVEARLRRRAEIRATSTLCKGPGAALVRRGGHHSVRLLELDPADLRKREREPVRAGEVPDVGVVLRLRLQVVPPSSPGVTRVHSGNRVSGR